MDLNNWRHRNGPDYPLQPFNVNWQPNGDKILFWDSTWTFLYDLATNSGCEFNPARLSHPSYPAVHRASWSPNGRYLLLDIAEYPLGTQSGSGVMSLLDTYRGELTQYPANLAGDSFSWTPDNQTVALIRQTGERSAGFKLYGTYLLNTQSKELRQILANPTLEVTGAKWSPDGSRLAY